MGDKGAVIRILSDSAVAVILRSDFSHGYGSLTLRGPSSTITNTNVSLDRSDASNDPGDGAIYIFDDTGSKQAGMEINAANQGVIFADVKNFRIEHSLYKDQEIWYVAIEGPEVAIYERYRY